MSSEVSWNNLETSRLHEYRPDVKKEAYSKMSRKARIIFPQGVLGCGRLWSGPRKKILPGVLAAFLAVLLAAPTTAAAVVEVRIGFGGWTLSPFHTLIESRCEKTVQGEFYELLNSALPEWILSPVRTDIDMTSSGRSLYAEIWVPLGQSRFALGARGDVFRFRIPFTASASETIQVIGLPVADLYGTAAGAVVFDGLGISLLGRWKAFSSRYFDLALRAGVSGFPFRGRITMDMALLAQTPLGEDTYSGRLNRTIAEIRESDDDVPALVVAPVAGLEIGFHLDRRWSLYANISVSHGTFYSAGISTSL
jgi:hypothetical protein